MLSTLTKTLLFLTVITVIGAVGEEKDVSKQLLNALDMFRFRLLCLLNLSIAFISNQLVRRLNFTPRMTSASFIKQDYRDL